MRAAPAIDRSLIPPARDVFERAGYSADRIQEALGTEGELLVRPGERELPVHVRRLSATDEPLASLIRLFVLGLSVDAEDLAETVGVQGVEALVGLGLLDLNGPEAAAAVRIVSHDPLLIASDRSTPETDARHVASVHRPSAALAHLTIRRAVARALDVGTGNGIQALLVASHAEQVVATDVNERALEFAEFNAALNGIDNVEFRHGSFFDPLEGERFGLVVCNPPYVVSPESEFLFRDSGLRGDAVSEQVTQELPSVLDEEGFATVTVSWVQSGEDPTARPREWLRDSGCDAWVIHTSTDDPLATAEAWNRDVASGDELEQQLARWLAYYEELGIEAVAYGALVLRRRSEGPNWVKSVQVPRSGIHSAGPHLERLFSAQDFLGDMPGDQLLERKFRLHDTARLEQTFGPQQDGWTLAQAELALTDGLPFRAGLDPPTTAIVRRIAPTRSLEQILADAAVQLDADPDQFRRAGVEFVRKLLELGYVVPAES